MKTPQVNRLRATTALRCMGAALLAGALALPAAGSDIARKNGEVVHGAIKFKVLLRSAIKESGDGANRTYRVRYTALDGASIDRIDLSGVHVTSAARVTTLDVTCLGSPPDDAEVVAVGFADVAVPGPRKLRAGSVLVEESEPHVEATHLGTLLGTVRLDVVLDTANGAPKQVDDAGLSKILGKDVKVFAAKLAPKLAPTITVQVASGTIELLVAEVVDLPVEPASDSVAVEREYWELIRSSNDVQDYKDYLQAYPNGAYTAIARAKIKQLETVKNTRPADSQPTNTQPSNSDGNKSSKPVFVPNTSASRPKSFNNQQGIEMLYIPPGSFDMGSSNGDADDKPVHRVTIGQGFFIGKYEVTQGQWQAVMGANPSYFKGDDNLPVEQISWDDAQEFVNKLNEMNDGHKYRMPTEAEWEYACRAGTTGDYYAQDVDDIGWYSDNSGKKTHRVGSKQANAFGLYDMSGNVWEWCRDWHVTTYKGAPTDGSARLSGGEQKYRVLRGGSWGNLAANLRSALRNNGTPGLRNNNIGFRLVAVVRTP